MLRCTDEDGLEWAEATVVSATPNAGSSPSRHDHDEEEEQLPVKPSRAGNNGAGKSSRHGEEPTNEDAVAEPMIRADGFFGECKVRAV